MYLKLVNGHSMRSSEEFASRLSIKFSDDVGYGFSDTSIEDDIVTSNLIYQSFIYRQVYDQDADEFISERQVVYGKTPFSFRVDNSLLGVYVGGEKLQKLLSVMEQTFNYKIILDDVSIDINAVLQEIENLGYLYNVLGITIAKFRPINGIIGRFSASVSEQNVVSSLIENYRADVREIVLSLDFSEKKVAWKFASSGKLSVRAEEEILDEQVNLATDVIMRCQNA
jgi:hypothetical protein